MSQQNRYSLLDHVGKQPTLSKGKRKHKPTKIHIPAPVQEQRRLRSKFQYRYSEVNNGNVENNTTLYVNTGVAHHYQIEEIFNTVIEKAKSMPHVFGDDFECDVYVNLVRTHKGQYMGYAFVDISNPAVYYALIGCETDGTERVEYISDPNWTPPTISTQNTTPVSWADVEDDDYVSTPSAPKIRCELPSLLQLPEYKYDEQQKVHLKTTEKYGNVSISPAFITPGVNDDHDDCKLYVSDVPANDTDFLQAIFARYARASSYREDDKCYYPKIQIRKNLKDSDQEKYYAIIEYAHSYDAAFALIMLQKILAKYNGSDINMRVRYAFNQTRYHK